MKDIFFALWFFLPAGIANVTPIFAAHIPLINRWDYPLDFYLKINRKRMFGDHKTIRGFITGIILGTVTSILLFQIANHWSYTNNNLPNWYYHTNTITLGILLSFGALAGDAIKSFFKRQLSIQPGSTWIPFDQTDYIVGGLLLSSIVHPLTLLQYIATIVLWAGIHILSTYLGFFLKLKNQPL